MKTILAAIVGAACLGTLLVPRVMARQCSFAIYVAKTELPRRLMPLDLRHIKLQAEPVLTMTELMSYSRMSHAMAVTPSAYERFMKLPVGATFVVCASGERVYYGTVWSGLYSSSVDGIVIVKTPSSKPPVIRIQLGYPSPEFFTGTDPRSDPRIVRALRDAGKLVEDAR
jgi:hypothetical protein